MQLAHYLGLLHKSEIELADGFRDLGQGHAEEADVHQICQRLAAECDRHAEELHPFAERYGEDAPTEPERLHRELFDGTRSGPLGLLRDLHDLYLMASECDLAWTMIGQAAQGARDRDLLEVVSRCEGETALQLEWIKTRMKQAAPQVLVVAE
jgi:hypothetical protein